MFKNYLTYQFSVGFHRSCGFITAPHEKKERLMKSAATHLLQFSLAVRASDAKEELKFLCVALIALRDCKETLDELTALKTVFPDGFIAQYEVLHARMEQLCLKASEANGGQLRMLG